MAIRSPCHCEERSDVAISCDKLSRSSRSEKCCHLAPGDSHGPYGPRNDTPLPLVIAREQRDRGNPYPLAMHSIARLFKPHENGFPRP